MKTQQIIGILLLITMYLLPLIIMLIKYRPKRPSFDWYLFLFIIPIVFLFDELISRNNKSAPPFDGY